MCTLAINAIIPCSSRFLVLVPMLNTHVAAIVLPVSLIPQSLRNMWNFSKERKSSTFSLSTDILVKAGKLTIVKYFADQNCIGQVIEKDWRSDWVVINLLFEEAMDLILSKVS